jgi:acyl dehydratase
MTPGTAAAPFRGVIERAKLIQYAQALHLHNPIHRDRSAAVAAGFRDVVAPPGFVISNTLQPKALKLSTFGIDERRALAGEMRFEHLGVICAGDELHGQSTLLDVVEKQGRRRMTAFVIETTFDNQLSDRVLVFRETALQAED